MGGMRIDMEVSRRPVGMRRVSSATATSCGSSERAVSRAPTMTGSPTRSIMSSCRSAEARIGTPSCAGAAVTLSGSGRAASTGGAAVTAVSYTASS